MAIKQHKPPLKFRQECFKIPELFKIKGLWMNDPWDRLKSCGRQFESFGDFNWMSVILLNQALIQINPSYFHMSCKKINSSSLKLSKLWSPLLVTLNIWRITLSYTKALDWKSTLNWKDTSENFDNAFVF